MGCPISSRILTFGSGVLGTLDKGGTMQIEQAGGHDWLRRSRLPQGDQLLEKSRKPGEMAGRIAVKCSQG